jgi:RNA polymerase sigma-70 factor (ECF subfamily)
LDRGETDEILQSRPDQKDRDGAEQATATDEHEHLHRAFQGLPNEQSQVLELSYFKGMNQVEIAKKLGISLGTVKSRTRLGIEKLRNSLSTLRL